MAGKAGTPRFGMNPSVHPDEEVGPNGMGKLKTSMDGPWTETHFAYNPAQRSRDMGTTRGENPAQFYVKSVREVDYMSNHDGYVGGDMHLMSLDERKVLSNTIYSTKCEYAGDSPNGGAPSMTMGAFD